jgi:CsoR family transcriptional regulator, copper-sensing transcriptional repressor
MESDSRTVTVDEDVDRVLNRLRRIEGQVRGLQRMVEEGKDCEAVLTQLAAVKSALDRVGIHLISHRMKECMGSGPGVAGDEARLEQAFEVFLRYRQGGGEDAERVFESQFGSPDDLPADDVQRVLGYLCWIETRVRGLLLTVEEGTDCEAVLSRLASVKSALDRVGIFLISHRMKECLDRGAADTGADPVERALGVFLKYAASAR